MPSPLLPTIAPLGDQALLVRFGDSLSEDANRAAVAAAAQLDKLSLAGVVEVTPNLVSLLVRFDSRVVDPHVLGGELRLALAAPPPQEDASRVRRQTLPVTFDGEDIGEVASSLGLAVPAFIAAHNAASLRVLSTGFSPGFLYCGFHPEALRLPRRDRVRRRVEPGTVLFAAGQTAITSTPIPTGWHVIGRTSFRNFDPTLEPPVRLRAGDDVVFEAAS